MDRGNRDPTSMADSSRPQTPFVECSPLAAFAKVQVLHTPRIRRSATRSGIVTLVFWVPLATAGSLGTAAWLGWPLWYALLFAAPGVLVAATSHLLPPRGRRRFIGAVSVTGALVSVIVFIELARSVELARDTGTEIVALIPVVFACTVSALLGGLFGLWLARRRRGV